MPDFREYLNVKADDVKRPEPLPAGTYFGKIASNEILESSKKKTPFVRYNIRVASAGEDVDQEKLAQHDLSKKQLRKDYYLTEDARYRLVEFAQKMGIQTAGRSIGEFLNELIGQDVMLEVTFRPNPDDPTAPGFNDVGDIGPIPE